MDSVRLYQQWWIYWYRYCEERSQPIDRDLLKYLGPMFPSFNDVFHWALAVPGV